MTELDLTFVDAAVRQAGGEPDAVVGILQAVQDNYNYLPAAALQRVCELTQISPAAITGVASFYSHFRHEPAGEHRVRICHGTACHVKGAELIQQGIEQHLGIPVGCDTDADRRYTLEKVACLGCCTLAPVIQIDNVTYGHLTPEQIGGIFADFEERARRGDDRQPAKPAATGAEQNGAGRISIGLGSCCMVKGSGELHEALRAAAADHGVPVSVQPVGCVGMCHRTPLVEVEMPDGRRTLYAQATPDDAAAIVQRHFPPPLLTKRIRLTVNRWLDRISGDGADSVGRHAVDVRDPTVTAFLGPQRHVATEHFGQLDPLDFDQYLRRGGFQAWRQCLTQRSPAQVIEAVDASGLRGRGGAGFPTGRKWTLARAAEGATKYVVCNGDEGDPGAFMDRMLLESFPYRIIEGLALAAYAIGATEGIFYIRHEYPLAVERVAAAIRTCREHNWLGDDILGTGVSLNLSIRQGAGAFICGEETALIASIEGRRGTPTRRPPYPVECGLWDKPTLINNVETLALVPWIINHGADAFAAMGTAQSKGTKVFALAGKVQRGGLIEVPMGITLRRIIEDIGGGIADGRQFKAVQIGGPSGGCIPAELADTPVDYEALQAAGAIMGSGGLVVLDEGDCMVDLARYFLQFTQDQSCGKCTFCRIGTRRMLDILERICRGDGRAGDLDELAQLAEQVQQGSLCGLGGTAPNPVLTTLRYFRAEYEAHLHGRCPAGRCKELIRYVVNDACVGCTICSQHCAVDAIPMTPYRKHAIDDDACTRCDTCRLVCPHDAIEVQ